MLVKGGTGSKRGSRECYWSKFLLVIFHFQDLLIHCYLSYICDSEDLRNTFTESKIYNEKIASKSKHRSALHIYIYIYIYIYVYTYWWHVVYLYKKPHKILSKSETNSSDKNKCTLILVRMGSSYLSLCGSSDPHFATNIPKWRRPRKFEIIDGHFRL